MTAPNQTQIDPITTQVIGSGLIAAAEEMRVALVQTAYSPLIYEVQDFAVAILSNKGEMMAQGSSLPLFLSGLSWTIQNGVKKFGLDGFSVGDVIIANDPYSTGTHISDTSIYTPIFFDGELQAFSANTAHWADIGGKTPGGWCPDSNDVFQEGMIFSHLKLYDAGQINESTLSENIRDFDIEGITPDLVIISPKPGERVLRQDLYIALSYFSIKDVDPKRVKVFLDGKDVSGKAQIDSSYLSISSIGITTGLHTVRVNISNIYRQKFNDFSWSFTVVPGDVIGFGTIKKQTSKIWANYTAGEVNKQNLDFGEINFLVNNLYFFKTCFF